MGTSRLRPERLGNGQVDVWLTRLSSVTFALQLRYRRLLNETERKRFNGFLMPNAQLQYLVTRVLVRATLSRYARVAEAAWQFDTGSFGRPCVSTPERFRDLQFNVSHTDGIVACAVSRDCDIGIDVEYVQADLNIGELTGTVLAPFELEALERLKPERRREYFYAIWTLKEAYAKARGLGLSIALKSFWFDLANPFPRVILSDHPQDCARRWRFYLSSLDERHRMAIAIAAPHDRLPQVRLRWVTPLAPLKAAAA